MKNFSWEIGLMEVGKSSDTASGNSLFSRYFEGKLLIRPHPFICYQTLAID